MATFNTVAVSLFPRSSSCSLSLSSSSQSSLWRRQQQAYLRCSSFRQRPISSYTALLRVHPSRRAWISSSPQISTSLNISMSFQMAAIAFCTKSSKDASNKGTRCKFFPASTAHFGSLAFTLLKTAVPCHAMPCQHTFAKRISQHSTVRHSKTRVYTSKKSSAMLAHFFGPV